MKKFVSLFVLVLAFTSSISFGADDASKATSRWYIKTADVVKDVIQVGGRLRTFNSLDTLSQPIGFATNSSDQTGIGAELSLQVKYRKFAFEYLPLTNSRKLDTGFYGASLGEVKVNTSNVLIGKFFPFDLPGWGAVSIGLGAECTELKGAVSMGGFVFPTTGNGWSPVFQVSYWYHLMKWMSLRLDYERSNVRVVTKIPGVPDLVSTYESRLALGLSFGFGFGNKY